MNSDLGGIESPEEKYGESVVFGEWGLFYQALSALKSTRSISISMVCF